MFGKLAPPKMKTESQTQNNFAAPRANPPPILRGGDEHYAVRALGVTAIGVFAGDEIQIHDSEGRQPAHILAVDAAGAGCTEKLGLAANARGGEIYELLQNGGEAAARILREIKNLGADLRDAPAALTMQGDTPPGNSLTFTAEEDAICLVAAPGAKNARARTNAAERTFCARTPQKSAAAFVAFAAAAARRCVARFPHCRGERKKLSGRGRRIYSDSGY